MRLFTVWLLLLAATLEVWAAEPSARELFKRGRKYEKAKDYANAYIMYSQAAAADPSRREYWIRAQALQRRAASSLSVAPTDPKPEILAQPIEELPAATEEESAEARRLQPPVDIIGAPGAKDFDLRADARVIWEQVTKAYALDVIFDGDYPQTQQPLVFRMTGIEYREALTALMAATSSFIVPISERLLLVVKDTEVKRREVENTVAFSVPIPDPFTIQEAQELGRSVQQVMEIQRFAIDSRNRVAIFRDRISKARPAQLLFQQLIGVRAQVDFEVELISAARSSTLGLGLTLPATFPLTPLTERRTLSALLPAFSLGVGGAQLLARATKSDSKTLYKAQIRAVDGQAASLHVGEKYPIMTVGYVGIVEPGEQVYRPPPSFNFEDLGIVLKLTPRVHDGEEVSIDIESEFKMLGAGSINGIPVISNRKFATRARLRFDEAAVISGLVARNDLQTLSGPAGLLNIPVLGTVLGQSNWTKDDVQLLLIIRPRLVTLPPSETVTRGIWVGSESRPRIPL